MEMQSEQVEESCHCGTDQRLVKHHLYREASTSCFEDPEAPRTLVYALNHVRDTREHPNLGHVSKQHLPEHFHMYDKE